VRVAPISGGEDAACGDMDSLPSRQKNQNPLKVALDRKKWLVWFPQWESFLIKSADA